MVKRGVRLNRKGYYFTLDAVFATILIGTALVLSSKYFISEAEQPQVNYFSRDIVNSLSNIKVGEIDDPYIQSLIDSNKIADRNRTIIEQIGEFYILNESGLARNLSKLMADRLIPPKFGFEILLNNISIYGNNSGISAPTELVSSRRMISGIQHNKPFRGATSKVFLDKIQTKKYSEYVYFGGFVGQGNITVNTSLLPEGAVFNSMELELDAGGDFYLHINGEKCNAFDPFHPVSERTVAERWNITQCIEKLDDGSENRIELKFEDLMNNSFVAGGFLRIDYDTDEIGPYFEGYKIRYNFPGVYGVVNLFDAFFVPGTINSMNISLHFMANDTSYLTIGGKIIHKWDGSESEQQYFIGNSSLATSDYASVADDFPKFSNNTIPVRFASYESVTTVLKGGDADVILVTDLSGSMKNAVDSWLNGNSAPTCDNFVDNPNTRRTRAAVCLDINMTNILMNFSGNRMWPIFMRKNEIINYTWNPSSREDVIDMLDNYYNDQGLDKTCLACAINHGYDLLKAYSNESRKKFLILMTDGCPTHCADDAAHSCRSNSSEYYEDEECTGLCDTSGGCDVDKLPIYCSDCTTNDGAIENALYSAQRIHDDLNVTIFTIGFGPMDDCDLANYTLHEIARIGNGTYQHSDNVLKLQEIYQNISFSILEQVAQYTQAISERGNITNSILFPDSYIDVEYIPIAEQPAYDEIAIYIEEPKFSTCTPTFDVPTGMRVTDAKITSYSGEHWTDYVSINGKEIYNLSDYFLDYVKLGDPFFVYVPVNNIRNGTNSIEIMTADTPMNKTGCSFNNTIIYTGLVKSSISYADVKPRSEGCNWTVMFDDNSIEEIKVPNDYLGNKSCSYTNDTFNNFDYDVNDSIDIAAFQLFDSLDYNDDGKVFVKFSEFDLVVNAISVRMIPYPWGPAIAEVRVWK